MLEDVPHFITQTHEAQPHECGPDAFMKLNCVLDCFQDIAAKHAEILHVGMVDLQQMHQLWVLSRLKLKFNRCPALNEKLTVMTYPTGLNKLFATRQYQMIDSEGIPCITGTSFWIVIDDRRFRPVRPMPMLAEFENLNLDKPRFYSNLEKISERETVQEKVLDYTVLESNIDLNKHLNNAFYGSFLVDTLGTLSGKLCHPKELQINFLHPGALNTKIRCTGKISEDGRFYVEGHISAENILCFQAEGML